MYCEFLEELKLQIPSGDLWKHAATWYSILATRQDNNNSSRGRGYTSVIYWRRCWCLFTEIVMMLSQGRPSNQFMLLPSSTRIIPGKIPLFTTIAWPLSCGLCLRHDLPLSPPPLMHALHIASSLALSQKPLPRASPSSSWTNSRIKIHFRHWLRQVISSKGST